MYKCVFLTILNMIKVYKSQVKRENLMKHLRSHVIPNTVRVNEHFGIEKILEFTKHNLNLRKMEWLTHFNLFGSYDEKCVYLYGMDGKVRNYIYWLDILHKANFTCVTYSNKYHVLYI